MAEFLNPNADISGGGWTNEGGTSTLYTSIDELSPGATDYIKSGLDPVADPCVVGLSGPPSGAVTPVTISYMYGKETNNSDEIDLTVRLLQTTTEIAAWAHTNIPYTAVRVDQVLTAPQLATITNANLLRLEFTASVGDPTKKLNLDFTSGTLDSRITFARSTTGMYYNASGLLASAAVNTPRFTYNPSTLAAQGLLVEPQTSNLFLYSTDFSNAAWVCIATRTYNAAVAPDGTTTATRFSQPGGGQGAHTYQAFSSHTAGDTLNNSIYVKQGSPPAGFLQVVWEAGGAGVSGYFNLSTGAWGTVGGGLAGTPTVEALPNGWYRISAARVYSTTSGCNMLIRPADADNNNYASDAISFYMWGPQLRVGAEPTSYIPTTSTAVTRGVDYAALVGTNFSSWYVAGPATVVFESIRYYTNATALTLIGPGDWMTVNNNGEGQLVDGSVEQALFTPTVPTLGVLHKYAMAVATNDVAYVVDGGTPMVDTTATVPDGFTELNIGQHPSYGLQTANIVKAIKYFNVRKSNADLQALTA